MGDVTVGQKGPYGRVEPLTRTLRKITDTGLPDPLTSAVLQRIGISPFNAYQTIQGVEFLGITKNGRHTPIYETLRKAPSSQYKEILAEIVRNAYEPIFALVDPAKDDTVAISDAFKNLYEPAGQRERMVALFLGLCREAGILPEDKVRKQPLRKVRSQPQSAKSRKMSQQSTQELPQAQQQQVASPTDLPTQRLEQLNGSGRTTTEPDLPPADFEDANPDYRMLYQMVYGLFNGLPRNGRWTKTAREKWVNAYNAMTSSLISTVDWLVEVTEE